MTKQEYLGCGSLIFVKRLVFSRTEMIPALRYENFEWKFSSTSKNREEFRGFMRRIKSASYPGSLTLFMSVLRKSQKTLGKSVRRLVRIRQVSVKIYQFLR